MKVLVLAAATASLLFLPGCLIRSSSKTVYSGRFIGGDTIKQIEPGKSKDDFVLAVLGAPTSKTELSDGSQVWKWEYRKKHTSSGAVFLIVDADDHTETTGSTYVVMRDCVVEKVWQD